MTSSQPPLPLDRLEGVIERLVFQNEETGFTVARLTPTGRTYSVVVVGDLSGAHVGEALRLTGQWVRHPEHGQQFEVRTCEYRMPATVEGMRKYLGSGLIRGVGPVFASRIVERFGAQTFDVIENDLEKLRQVEGIGEKRLQTIRQAWEAQKVIKEIILFLQSHGVSSSLAVKVYRQYADQSIQVLREDPYRLARDIYGIGFKTADKIARMLGMPPDSPKRLQAGLLYAMSELSNEGHCFAFQTQLVEKAASLLEAPPEKCSQALQALLTQGDLVLESQENLIYLPAFYQAENAAAEKLRRMLAARHSRLQEFQSARWEDCFERLSAQTSLRLTEEQLAAIRMALTGKVSLLTGGPGTGKSTIVRSIVNLVQAQGKSVLLAAPTGRAAKRLSELTGAEARTIHRLLEFSPSARGQFLRDRENPLDTDLVIIDEVSMVDILLLYHLLNAIEDGSHLLLVGDADQLPSVGPGNVLKDLLACQKIPSMRLNTIFRQAQGSYIIQNAHAINQGKMPLLSKEAADFFFFPAEDASTAADWVVDIVARRMPQKFGFHPLEDIQVLCPMHRGAAGVAELNRRLQEILNPPQANQPEVRHGSQAVFRIGDRVMQLRNDYERLIFNGDMGIIQQIDLEDQAVRIDFDGRLVECDFTQMDEITLAYAVSIHKSQGSEYPAVVIPLLGEHYMMLQRNLLYTAVTRARRMVVLVGSRKAIGIAVRNNRLQQRNTRLAQRLA